MSTPRPGTDGGGPLPPLPDASRASAATAALRELRQATEAHAAPDVALGNWRWTVRQRMAGVRDVLVRDYESPQDGWLSARGGAVLRERTALLMRMSELGPRVLEEHDVARVRADLLRLVVDVDHHLQRLRDLAYDDVELELGGSE